MALDIDHRGVVQQAVDDGSGHHGIGEDLVPVAEAAVVGRPDELKGQGIVAFVTLAAGNTATPALKDDLKGHVAHSIGSFAKPDEIRFTDALPKTRSGKIMRRLLRDLASGQTTIGDTTTLEDFSVLAKLREEEE